MSINKMQTIQSNSGKYRAEIKTRENVKIIRNSDNHIIHTTGPGHRTLNKFVTIKDQECKDHECKDQEWWFGGDDYMQKVLVNCDTEEVYKDPEESEDEGDEGDEEKEQTPEEEDLEFRRYMVTEFIWVGPYIISPNGKYMLMHGCVWGWPYMYNLFDISDLAKRGPKFLLIRDYISKDECDKIVGMIGVEDDKTEYDLQNNTLTVCTINPHDNSKKLNYTCNLPNNVI